MSVDHASSFDAALNAIRSTGVPLVSANAEAQAAALLAMESVAVSTVTGGTIFTTKSGESLANLARTRLASDMAHFAQAASVAAQQAVEPSKEQKLTAILQANPNMGENEKILTAAKLGFFRPAAPVSHDQARTDISKPFGLKRVQ